MGDLGGSINDFAEREWEIIARIKKLAQFSKIPAKWRIDPIELASLCDDSVDLRRHIEAAKILSDDDRYITNITSVATLWDLIDKKVYTAVEVVTAFCKRAAIAHQLTNCLTEIFFDEAIENAKELDAGPSMGAWHGIPVSLKDQFQIIGHDTTIGYVARVNYPATKNSELVDCILEQGGVFYCKTSVPQTVMTADTVSNLFGRTLNPVNKNIIPSGSSGGEAALLACRGSIIGIGTDTGGSIRNPAAACEIYGLKTSFGRLSFKNVVASNDGNPLVTTVAGPMATSLDSLEYFMANTISQEPWYSDPDVVAIPWTPRLFKPESLRIGIMLDHGDPKPPHKSFYRIIDNLSAKLAQAGVTLVRWESDELSRIHRALAAVLGMTCLMDGGADIARQVNASGEPLILSGFVNDKFLLSIPEVWKINVKIRKLKTRYLELWRGAKLDAVISPTNTFAFLTKEEYLNKPPEVGYSSIFNVLDYSVVNIPAGPLIEEDLTPEHIALGLEGFNVGCQVACGRLEEEKALAIAKVCRDVLT